MANIRIQWPDYAEAKRIVLGILQTAGGYYNGAVRLNKVFYDAHLFHWKHYGRYLTSHPIARMPNGPGIDGWALLLDELTGKGDIRIGKKPSGPYTEDVFTLADGVAPDPPLSPEEVEAIESAINWVGNKSAGEISKESHERSRTWRGAQDGKTLHAILDTLSDIDLAKKQEILKSIQF